ncbi:MAG: histidine phosphatase family protein [Planctomycetales bacterium]|nr:histidine phosphatase family protein [Planctomycetales bacterium]
MGSIAFFRHAQASFFSDDYDRLSEHGQRQAHLLGEHWRSQDTRFGKVVVGPCRRHRQTAEIALAVSGNGTDLVELPEFDEHQVDQLLIEHRHSIAAEFPDLLPLVAALDQATERPEQARRFQFLFEAITGLWLTGKVSRPGIEPWVSFQSRVMQGITKVLADPDFGSRQSRQIAVFSSVGPISIAFQVATGCSNAAAVATGWRLRNCSLTQAMFSKDRFTLDCFNTLPHLPDPGDWTFR